MAVDDLRLEMNRGFASIREEMERRFTTIQEEMNRRFNSMAELIAQVVNRIDVRADSLEHRLDTLERRMDRMGDSVTYITNQLSAITRWADRFDRDSSAAGAIQTAQQKAIDELAARVTRLEQRLGL